MKDTKEVLVKILNNKLNKTKNKKLKIVNYIYCKTKNLTNIYNEFEGL